MRTVIAAGVIASLICFGPSAALAQRKPAEPAKVEEIRLDETAKLKASSLEAQLSAIMARWALMQREAQDMQAELNRLLEERKKLIEDAAKKQNVEVKDTTEWAFEKTGQRYVKVRRAP